MPSEQDVAEYCRQIESYLCQKNDGHLIRVVGPSFELVSSWAARGVPLKVAFRGIDRSVERYHRHGAQRRPVRIDFCEADVLDVFDEWRRATGITAVGATAEADSPVRRGPSLPDHLQRGLQRLTRARAMGTLGSWADELIDRVSSELDVARAGRGIRGAARKVVVERLAAMDAELLIEARRAIDPAALDALRAEADAQLSAYRDQMASAAFARARERAIDVLIRDRLGLPTLAFT